mgnify:FL=1
MSLKKPKIMAVTRCLQKRKEQGRCQTTTRTKVAGFTNANSPVTAMEYVTAIKILSSGHPKQNEIT